MRSLSDTVERLARLRATKAKAPLASRLTKLERFGSNPGALSAWYHVPSQLPASPALVVILHGCTQTAAGYDFGSGWSRMADDYGFAVLVPEQVHANNSNLCFNWFNPADTGRDRGEALSIRQMIAAMVSAHDIDERRIYITGLSAGGAMANAMLATYPEVFAGGAIIAGLPYGVASTIPQAFDRMRGHGLPGTDVLQANLHTASGHQGPWPTISVWHGTNDNIVVQANAIAIIEQWRGLHRAASQPAVSGKVDGQLRMAWRDCAGREAIELYKIAGMGHGTPIDVASGYGMSGPFMLDAGISSTVHIARSWGLAASFERREAANEASVEKIAAFRADPFSQSLDASIQSVIEKALRSAGLIR
ncbi:MAG: PHB depolymerase family esterase [Pararhizobium sp.]